MVKFIVVFVILLILVFAGIILYCYDTVFHGTERRDSKELEVPQGEQYEPYHDTILRSGQKFLEVPFEKVTITAHDGVTLVGRYYHMADGAPVSIVFHGYRGSIARDSTGGFGISRKNGYNVLVVYQRAHKASGGKTITFGVKERYDCLDWVYYICNRCGKETPILLMGLSMGAATVLMAGGLDLPSNVKGIFADCGFSSPKEILQTVMKQMNLPVKPTYFFVRLSAILIGRFDPEEASAIEAMKKCKVPVLLIHGDDDRFVPCQMSYDNYEACVSTKELVIIKGAGHGLSYCVDAPAYEKAVQSFIDKVMADGI